jgi:hypothetical protein
MNTNKQLTIGIGLLVLGILAVLLQVTQHQDVYSLVAIFLGAVGGQQVGQATARRRRQ